MSLKGLSRKCQAKYSCVYPFSFLDRLSTRSMETESYLWVTSQKVWVTFASRNRASFAHFNHINEGTRVISASLSFSGTVVGVRRR